MNLSHKNKQLIFGQSFQNVSLLLLTFLIILNLNTILGSVTNFRDYKNLIRKRAVDHIRTIRSENPAVNLEDALKCEVVTETVEPGTARIELCNLRNYYYLGHIRIGVPPQTIWMEIDTGSSTTWVMTRGCTSQACRITPRFDPWRSITFETVKETFNFTYGAGDSVSGVHAIDYMCLGRLCIANQSFGAALKVNQNNMIADGLIGLGYPMLSAFGNPLITNLKPKLKEPLFAVSLRRNPFKMSNGGEITFGYVNSSLKAENFTYIPVVNQSYWSITMDKVLAIPADGSNSAGVVVGCQNGCQAIVDTATSFILGAQNETAKLLTDWFQKGLVQKDESSPPNSIGDYFVDCDQMKKLPNLAFVFAGRRFELTPEDYTFVQNPQNPCRRQVAIEADIPDLNFWVLGGSFLGPYYTVFDFGLNRVGIARATKLFK